MIKSASLLLPIYVTFMWTLVFLLQKRTHRKANKVLGVLMLSACIIYSTHAVFFLHYYQLYSFIECLYFLTLLSLYPLFYAYVLLLASNKIRFDRYIVHFLPGIIFCIFSLAFTLLHSHNQRLDYITKVLVDGKMTGMNFASIEGLKGLMNLMVRLIFIAQSLVYLLASIRITNKHNKQLNEYYSNIEGRSVHWIRNISIILILISVLGIFFTILGRSIFAKNEVLLFFPSFIFSVIYFLIGFFGNQQIVITEELTDQTESAANENEILGDSHLKLLKPQLLSLFEDEKIYRLSDLRITTVSETLQTNRTYISRLINEEFGVNFNEFVNKYRVKEAEALLKNEDNTLYTLDYIAEKAGFGSTNSFTRAFKEYKGVTPGTFRNKPAEE